MIKFLNLQKHFIWCIYCRSELSEKSLKVFRLKAAILGLKFVNLVMCNCTVIPCFTRFSITRFFDLQVCMFWFFRSSISLDPWFALIFKMKTNHFISQRNPILLIICLKKVDSVEFFDFYWTQFEMLLENGGNWNLKSSEWKYLFLRPHINRLKI